MFGPTSALAFVFLVASTPGQDSVLAADRQAVQSADVCVQERCAPAQTREDLGTVACSTELPVIVMASAVSQLAARASAEPPAVLADLSAALTRVDAALASGSANEDATLSAEDNELVARFRADQRVLQAQSIASAASLTERFVWRRALCNTLSSNKTFITELTEQKGFGALLSPREEVRSAALALIQHVDDPAMRQRALGDIDRLVRSGMPFTEEAAAIADRQSLRSGGSQIYGTHFRCRAGAAILDAPADPLQIGGNRRARGLPDLTEHLAMLNQVCAPPN